MIRRIVITTLASAAFAAILTACGTPPADLDLTLRHPSAQGRFLVQMDPPAQGPGINQMHAWQVSVSTKDGVPVSQARISIDGGMPQHGHGLPTKPRATRELEPGTYLVEGMKFSMTGWWDFKLGIQSVDASDTAVFNVIVDESGIRR